MKVVCCRCHAVVSEGDERAGVSHTFCLECLPEVYPFAFESVTDLDQEALDALPWGVVQLDAENRIIAYNAAEAELARRTREDVLGKNFFEDVAPCTNVRELAGWVEQAKAAGVSDNAETNFIFEFPFGRQLVRVGLSFDAPTRTSTIVVDNLKQEPAPRDA